MGEGVGESEHVGAEARGVLWMAMRYALGRGTAAVYEVVDAIEKHADELPEWTRERMAAEIKRDVLDMGAPWPDIRQQWELAHERLLRPGRP